MHLVALVILIALHNIVTTAFLIAWAVAFFAKMCDCYTTYVGVDVKKIAVEGDMAAFAQWLAVRPWALFTVNPALFVAILAIVHYVAWEPLTIGTTGLCIWFAVRSFQAAIHNNKINNGAK